MKTLTKNILISLFTILFTWTLFSTLSITYCYADEVKDGESTEPTVQIDGINYQLNDNNNTATVGNNTGYNEISGKITLPEIINVNRKHYKLVGFELDAFNGCKNLKEIIIPDSVTSLSNRVFNCCENLQYVKLPNGIEEITWYAFNNCCSLTSITIPESVRFIKQSAFSNCEKLKDINMPLKLEYIGAYAMGNCSSIESLIIPDSVMEIDSYAFNYDKNLKKIEFLGSKPLMNNGTFNQMNFDLYYPEDSYGWDTSDTKYQNAEHITYHIEKPTTYSYDGKIYFQHAQHNFVNIDLIVDGKITVSKKCPIVNGCAKFNFDKILKNSKVQICIHLDRFDFYTDECEIHSNLRNEFHV